MTLNELESLSLDQDIILQNTLDVATVIVPPTVNLIEDIELFQRLKNHIDNGTTATDVTAREMLRITRRYPVIFPGKTSRFIEKYLDPNTGPQDLFAPEWELENRIKTYQPLVEEIVAFETTIMTSIINAEIDIMTSQGFSVGDSNKIAIGPRTSPFLSFFERIYPTPWVGYIFSIARTTFQQSFEVTITRESSTDFSVTGQIFYRLTDSIRDAADYGDRVDGDQEFDGGFAYDLYADWDPVQYSKLFFRNPGYQP